MSRPGIERQLLPALLAFQNGFLDRPALLAAFDEWSHGDASQSLGELLVARKAIGLEKLRLVEALAEHFLERFDGDAAKSLARVAAFDSDVRDSLRQVAAPQVRSSLALRSSETIVPHAAGRHVGAATSGGSRFRILRPFAHGGIGEVFVAEDGELHREVALKQIQASYADDTGSRARFVLEAEVTGGLEHPNIVPVYGLGAYSDGRPFYAMRLIRGDSLQDAIRSYHQADGRHAASRSLEFRKLLGRFIDVCEAVDYAHSRGVLHRDLKPGNVMLGNYGETLVVDWGLAKVVGRADIETPDIAGERTLHPSVSSDTPRTEHGTAHGTPGYMSPEQAAGRVDELGRASDVYSLGATLYHILTGRAPFSGELGVVLGRIARGDFDRPRQVNADVSRPLEAVCLKAMALDPRDRYATVGALAEDVEHWLADEPVTARPEGVVDRVRRYGRKHRALVVSGGAALVVVAGVSLSAAVSIDRSRRGEQTARHQAETSAEMADEQRQVALETLNSLVFDVQKQLSNRPGLSDLKRRILETARANLNKISSSLEDPTQAIGHLSGNALLKTGEIFVTLGATDDAKKMFSEAQRLFEQAVGVDPTNAQNQADLSQACLNLGNVVAQQGDLATARKLYEQCWEIRRKLADADPGDVERQRDLSAIAIPRGDVFVREGNLREARKLYEQAWEIRRTRLEADPKNPAALQDVSTVYQRLGDVTLESGDLAAARNFYEQKLDVDRRSAELDPTGLREQVDLALSYDRLANATVRQGDLPAAEKLYQQALEIRSKLAEADPSDVLQQYNLSISYSKLGDTAMERRDFDLAHDRYLQYMQISGKLVEQDPADVRAQSNFLFACKKIGDVALAQDDLNQAGYFFKQQLTFGRAIIAAGHGDAEIQRIVSAAYDDLADVAGRQGNWEAARLYYDQSREIRARLVATDPGNGDAQRDLSIAYHNLGDVALKQGELATAQKWYEQYAAIRLKLAEADLANAKAQRDAALAQFVLGNALRDAKNYKAAIDAYRTGRKFLQRVIDAKVFVDWSRQLSQAFDERIAECTAELKTP